MYHASKLIDNLTTPTSALRIIAIALFVALTMLVAQEGNASEPKICKIDCGLLGPNDEFYQNSRRTFMEWADESWKTCELRAKEKCQPTYKQDTHTGTLICTPSPCDIVEATYRVNGYTKRVAVYYPCTKELRCNYREIY